MPFCTSFCQVWAHCMSSLGSGKINENEDSLGKPHFENPVESDFTCEIP